MGKIKRVKVELETTKLILENGKAYVYVSPDTIKRACTCECKKI